MEKIQTFNNEQLNKFFNADGFNYNQHIEFRLKEKDKFGFKKPTCIIDTQSAPALAGVEAEQKYMRAFLMAGKNDLVVTDFQLNETYINDYLNKTLNFELPRFLVTANTGKSTLTENLIEDEESCITISNWAEENNGQVQLFNVTNKEKDLIEKIDVTPTSGDLKTAIEIGSKPGFKQLCKELDVPVADGGICASFSETKKWVLSIMENDKNGFIKAENGTGGTELQSNITFSKDDFEKSGLDIDTYIQSKLDYFGDILGEIWVVEEEVKGNEGSVHVYINPKKEKNKSFILGALTENNSYVGGYYPYEVSPSEEKLLHEVDTKLTPALKAMGVNGFHCFDFKGDCFLEDNIRPGALDFIHQFVGKIIDTNFKNQKYAWYHCHIPISNPTDFETVMKLLGDKLDPNKLENGCFAAVSNQEVLPYGRSIDLTIINIGDDSSVKNAEEYFGEVKKIIQEKL